MGIAVNKYEKTLSQFIVNYSGRSEPASEPDMSGDHYHVTRLDQDRGLILLADVAVITAEIQALSLPCVRYARNLYRTGDV